MPVSGPDRSQQESYKVYAGDVGTILRMFTDIDLSDASVYTIKVKDPNGVEDTWPGTREDPYSSGVIWYQTDTTNGYFDTAGEYLIQTYVEFGTNKFHGETVAITAHEAFD